VPHITMIASTDIGDAAPIHQAVLFGHMEATKLLLEREPLCLFFIEWLWTVDSSPGGTRRPHGVIADAPPRLCTGSDSTT